jgi:hypothetical protein
MENMQVDTKLDSPEEPEYVEVNKLEYLRTRLEEERSLSESQLEQLFMGLQENYVSTQEIFDCYCHINAG